MNSGIYKILNTFNGKIYVGSAINFKKRWSRHRRLLNSNKHPNKYLQAAWNKYGEIWFEFSILQIVDGKENLVPTEQIWLDWFECYERDIGYNICKIADSRTWILHTQETKDRLSRIHKGRVKTPEWQAKITEAITGKKRDPSVGKAHAERMRNREFTDETRANMAKGQTGRKHSQESKDKRSVLLKGKPFNNPKKDPKHSEETKQRIREARYRYLARLKEERANLDGNRVS